MEHPLKVTDISVGSKVAAQIAPRVLVIADSMETFLGVVRSLGRKGLEVHLAASADDHCGARSRYVAALHLLPRHESQPDDWIVALRQLIARLGFPLIVPCDDRAVRLLDAYRAILAPSPLAILDSTAIAVLADKAATRAAAARLAIPIAKAMPVAKPGDAARAAASLGFPLVIKPSRSFSVGDSEGKMFACILQDAEDINGFDTTTACGEWIAEEFIDGVGKGVSVLACRGEILIAWQHRRIATTCQTGASSIRVGEPVDPRLLRDCAALAGDTALNGIAMFEFRVCDNTDRYVLIEVNPRFWGSLPTAMAAGVDFPAMLWDLLSDGQIKISSAPRRFPVRYHFTGEYLRRISAFDEADKALPKLRAGLDILALLARMYVRRTSVDTFAKDDVAPFIAERRWILAYTGRAVAKRLRANREGSDRTK